MSAGKKVAQGCHAAVTAVEYARKYTPSVLQAWGKEGQKKIALKVKTEEELLEVYQSAKNMDLPCSLIQDAGLTQLEPGTKTAVAIGPAESGEIDRITSNLKLL
jgi:peptidyl-tRNA hydrolase, PTH2 family